MFEIRHRYYDYDGEPIDVREWATLFELRDADGEKLGVRWRVGMDQIGDYEISTVWTGLATNFIVFDPFGDEVDDRPLIFETMVFKGGYGMDEYREQYATAEEAQAGHARWCKKLREQVALMASIEGDSSHT